MPAWNAEQEPMPAPPRWAIMLVAFLALTASAMTWPARAAGPQAEGAPYTIAVHVSSDKDGCYTPGLVRAIKKLTRLEAAEISRLGGINGTPLQIRFFDDVSKAEKSVANIQQALSDDRLLAMIGLSSSTRGRAVFDGIGQQIGASGVPFITEISVNKMFADYANVFTLANSVGNELRLLKTFIKEHQFKRPAFVGLSDHLYVTALGDGLKAITADPTFGAELVADHRIKVKSYNLTSAQAAPAIADIRQRRADVIFMGLQSGAGRQFVRYLVGARLQLPIFVVLGRLTRIMPDGSKPDYAKPMYQFDWDGVPGALNERLRQRIWQTGPQGWIFDQRPNVLSKAKWARGGCKAVKIKPLVVMDARNRRSIGRGAQYRDMVALIAEAAKSAPARMKLPALRRHIVNEISNYTQGRRVLRGWWRDWSFTPARASAADRLIITRAGGNSGIVLSPIQYAGIGGALEARPVVYISLDLISISRIDTNDKSFDAEFYLSLKSGNRTIDINSIEFTNAYRSQTGKARLISWRKIHGGGAGTKFPSGVKLYKVSGKFTFRPDLSRYPFDTQRLSISFQPASTSQPFLIQPPPKSARGAKFDIDGWDLLDQYVGSDQDIIPTIDQHVAQKRIVPFYKFNYSWVASRIAVDYYLRVVVPLGFILLVTYFSIFLHPRRFDSIMAIQVTALLSSIALYISLPKVDSDQATLSDKIFMVTYAAVSLMIGLSILKDNKIVRRFSWLRGFVAVIQIAGFPIAAISVMSYLILGTRAPGAGWRSIASALSGLFG